MAGDATTYAIMKSYDVCVVGAGVVGSSTARFLASQGKRTLLLEQVRNCSSFSSAPRNCTPGHNPSLLLTGSIGKTIQQLWYYIRFLSCCVMARQSIVHNEILGYMLINPTIETFIPHR